MPKRDELLADLLMGAAHADDHLDGRELRTVRDLLARALGVEALPSELEARLTVFDPDGFDAAAATAALGLVDDAQKRSLLELVVAVGAADEVNDFAEDEYLRVIATALGVSPGTYNDLALALDVDSERLGAAGSAILAPPLVPKSTR